MHSYVIVEYLTRENLGKEIRIYMGELMMKDSDEKKAYLNTTIPKDLLKSLKILAAQEGVRINYLLKEAIQDVLKKYEKKH